MHSNDSVALKSISRQLHIYYDGDEITAEKSSFKNNLNYVLQVLTEGAHSNQSIVIVIEEFELFV
jgi:hypothetical protein